VALAAARCMRVLHFRCPEGQQQKLSRQSVSIAVKVFSELGISTQRITARDISNQVGSLRNFCSANCSNLVAQGLCSFASFFLSHCMPVLCFFNDEIRDFIQANVETNVA
jgi:hypothetical protein